jgi:hypothetical protein
MGDPEVVGETVMTLHAFNIPLILASPRLADSVIQEGNILTTAPDMSSVVKVRNILTAPAVLVNMHVGLWYLKQDCRDKVTRKDQQLAGWY